MKKHPTKIDGYATLEDAAIAVGKLRFDKLAEFFLFLKEEMERQQTNDELKGRIKLADDAESLINSINDADFHAQELFEKYKKFLKDEL